MDWTSITVWVVLIIIALVGLYIMRDNKSMLKFVTSFAISLIVSFFLIRTIANPMVLSTIFALTIGILIGKDG